MTAPTAATTPYSNKAIIRTIGNAAVSNSVGTEWIRLTETSASHRLQRFFRPGPRACFCHTVKLGSSQFGQMSTLFILIAVGW